MNKYKTKPTVVSRIRCSLGRQSSSLIQFSTFPLKLSGKNPQFSPLLERWHGIKAGFIYRDVYSYQVIKIPLKVNFLCNNRYISNTPSFLHNIHVRVYSYNITDNPKSSNEVTK
jgi:hypothetical protein